ncbi:hypothetical protein [Hydrogenophaga luteola]|uniref:Uncharacterized protein n=1 Tax=Hydrogenophaga luteola TaxID=1591122 RepID=A0ABV7W4C3_9BURK
MSLQRSVAQQNESTLAKIQQVAALLSSGSALVSWLPGLLGQQGLNCNDGLLVALDSVTEQDGEQFFGTWLTREREFWEFAIVVSRESGAILEIEHFRNVTRSTVVSSHVPGTGKSFGYLALQAIGGAHGGSEETPDN